MHIFELFRRHFYPGISLGAIAVMLDYPVWLKRENVRIVDRLRGKLPFPWSSTATIVVIEPRLPADNRSAIYLKIEEMGIGEDIVFDVLKGNDKSQEHISVIVAEAGYSEME